MPLKICFVSYDILGPIRNGGIGTAMTSAAEALTEAGHDVTILYPSSYVEEKSISYWVLEYQKHEVRLESLFSAFGPVETSYLIYKWLAERDFEVVHFHDWQGPGYWSFVAKRQGLAFASTTLVCQAHGQTIWHLVNSSEFLNDIKQLELDFIERRSVELADVLYSPSEYMIHWMRSRGWKIPENYAVIPNLLPAAFPLNSGLGVDDQRSAIKEVVFFGRLEARKGLDLFCRAMSYVLEGDYGPRRITFLGKEGSVGPTPAIAYIADAAAGWKVEYTVLNDKDVFGAKAYLSGAGRLAVIASTIENSPYTVLECLAAGIPFLAPNVGGVAELIASDDQPLVLYSRTASALAEAITRCLHDGAVRARSAFSLEENKKTWLEWHDRAAAGRERPFGVPKSRSPLVSVCMSHHSRPELLDWAIRSIQTQTYPNVELVLVDDASQDQASLNYLEALETHFSARNWILIRSKVELWAGAARNLAASKASGEYILFMDDDNVAKPHEIETFVRVALTTGADVLTCQQQPFVGLGSPPEHEAELPVGWMALGPNLPQALFTNCLGDLNMLVRRSAWEAIGGFTEERYGCEDWEFLMKAILGGLRLEVIPEMLFFYRHSGRNLAYRYGAEELYNSMRRPMRPVLDALRPDLREALSFIVEFHMDSVRAKREGYWAVNPNSTDISQRISELPMNDGQALVELARSAVKSGNVPAACLIYAQALSNSLQNRNKELEALITSGSTRSSVSVIDSLIWELVDVYGEATTPLCSALRNALTGRAAAPR